ncbi:MAG: low molecular weight phosphotyrosine protein phosphatase [Mangrovimonas sp.]|nr:low molecular weight phosphotyrosine protein phosphatase [Mangrovimonas sp.]MCB0469849.1 low molecular weight phosphotyrosine protein phosphatase [Flavobacteriaceae bacterium]MCB0428317.1 low molecular weight phosphotyrosine protein phosphatase [Mangrovimonas sp.]MCB0433192.1 low molecular weight phosphotyrosine protein phosphatase [Mangrovimonas sp.]MCB0436638.1 low molecular weight phosphotyrosine protein phosphatase [Mangrovimonas sp.]
MVCLGNICRSPLAEGILRSKVEGKPILVDSAGTGNYHVGDPPDRRSIEIAKKYGLDISNLRGRQFTATDFDTFDLIYIMDESNYTNVLRLARTEEDKAKVRFILDEVYPGQKFNVPDPYHSEMHAFESLFRMLDEACNLIASKL